MRIYNFIRAFVKNALINRTYSILTLSALSLGIAISLLVLMYVYFEISFDRQWSGSERIYRAYSYGEFGDDKVNSAITPFVFNTILDGREGLESYTRILPGSRRLIIGDGIRSMESGFCYADSSFFKVFDLKFVAGDMDAFSAPDAVVITESCAERLFGDRDPIGERLKNDIGVEFVVAGIVEDLAETTHLRFDFIGNLSNLVSFLRGRRDLPQSAILDNWLHLNSYTYVKLSPDYGEELLGDIIADAQAKLDSSIAASGIADREALGRVSLHVGFQPVHAIHLFSELEDEIKPRVNPIYIKSFAAILLFVLLMTAVNFINLTMARASNRYKEVAVRKYFGAGKRYIVNQFMTEALIYSFIALFVALVLVEQLLPLFNSIFGVKMSSAGFIRQSDTIWILVLTMILGISAGVYPAVFFSGLKPEVAIHGSMKMKRWGVVLRGLLVSLQVSLTLCLMVLSFGMQKQVDFLRSSYHGFEDQNAVILEAVSTDSSKLIQVADSLRMLDKIAAVGAVRNLPGADPGLISFRVAGDSSRVLLLSDNYIGLSYFEALGTTLLSGRYPDERASNEVVINEAAARFLGYMKGDSLRLELLGGMDSGEAPTYDVVGVVHDISHIGLKSVDRPMIFIRDEGMTEANQLVLRFNEPYGQKVIDSVTELWERVVADVPVNIVTLKSIKEDFYRDDVRFAQMVTMFAIIALLLTVFSLISMASFEVQFFRKNLFIRKVMAAPFNLLLVYGLRSFALYLSIGIVLAIPVSDFLLHLWLDSYLKSIQVSFWNIALPAMFMLALSALAGYVTGNRELKRELYS